MRETLTATGITVDALGRLKAPAGLDIGAETQEEIALSIMAEIAMTRAAAVRSNATRPAEEPPVAGDAQEAIDPICGMTVVIAAARNSSEFDGRAWYFCCAGCKRRFDADPAQYAAA